MNESVIGAEMFMNRKTLLSKKTLKPVKSKGGDPEHGDDPELGDDNDEILELLKGRLALGRERYGHGVVVDQSTKDFGTEEDDWELMALEEMLDGLIYTTASIIRLRRRKALEK